MQINITIQIGTKMTNYPEHDKLYAIHNQSQIIGEFLTWLNSQGYSIEFEGMEIGELSFNGLLAEFFEIDLKKIETEKREILAELRAREEISRPTFVDLMIVNEAVASVALDNDEICTFSVEEMPGHGDKGE